jgi:class 3 adenylate cyclase
VLWNASEGPGGSPRSTTLAGLPNIVSTHFPDYVRLAALRLFGWEDAESAKRWERGILSHFSAETWTRLMDQLEAVDATAELPAVRARTLVLIDMTAVDARMPPVRKQYLQRAAAALSDSELRVLNKGGAAPATVIEQFLAEGEPGTPMTAPHGTAIVLCTDIVDSTALTERMGDAAFREKSRELDEALRSIIRERGGTVIDAKTLGDGVLATFPAASQAIDAALRCGAAGEAAGLPLHLGLHAGDVIREEGNVYGGAVNIAARISGMSTAGELLVSDLVRGLARTSAGVTFEDRGEHALKGVGEPVRVFAVRGLVNDEP